MFHKIIAFSALLATTSADLLGYGHAVSSQSIIRHDEGHYAPTHYAAPAHYAPAHYAAPIVHAAPIAHYSAPIAHYAPAPHYYRHDEYVEQRHNSGLTIHTAPAHDHHHY